MRATTCPLRALASLLFASLALCIAQRAATQVITPTAEQLQILRDMSPDQQEALKRRILGDSSGASQSRKTDDASSRNPGSQPQIGLFESVQQQQERFDRERLFLKAGDSVIVEIGFTLPPPDQNVLAAGAQPAAGGVAAVPGSPGAQVAGAPGSPAQANPQGSKMEVEPEPELTTDEKEELRKLIELVRSRNPYRLSSDGALLLPGFRPIPIAGLTQEQATLLLRAEREFQRLQVRLTRLPIQRSGVEALKPFGYDLFEAAPSTFAPVTDVPVPSDYIVGPGDQLNVQLYGSENRSVTLTVDRDGTIDFPQLGPLHVAGMRFNDAKQAIEQRVQRQMIGVQSNVSMADTRAIRVFVAGEANRPGSYTISGLGTVTSALYAAGGAKRIGSLRNIEVKRQGKLVHRLDLYDLLLRGDTSDDAKLLSGDVIFIPPVGPTVAVYGEVQRPAIYELRDETSVAQVVALAGGLTPQADATKAVLTQIDADQRRMARDVALTGASASGSVLRNGDELRVVRLRPTLDSGVLVKGHVHSPGVVAYRDGLRLSDVIPSVDALQQNADIHYLLVRREAKADRRVSVLSADLAAALAAPGSQADLPLAARDQITVFDLESGRDRIIRPLLEELRMQSTFQSPTEVVQIDGRTKVPGEYPLEPGMKVSDLIRAGGGLQDAAYGSKAELSRYTVVSGEARRTELIVVDLAAVLRGDANANIQLRPFDSLSIKEVQEWGEQEQITLIGEVRFPGKYAIRRGETLKSVIARAGGLNEYAFAEGSVFTRTGLKDREQQQLDVLAARLQNDLATLALQGAAANQAQAGTALAVGQSLLTQLRGSKAVGRLVIDLPRTLRSDTGSSADLALRGGDQLIVPRMPQEVTVIGEVQNVTSHLYRPELARDDYVGLSGGATRKADRKNIYVVHADGSVIANSGSRWFRSGGTVKMKPGDTVVVPLDTERLPALPFWQAVTQILYNLSISAAAVNSF